jgi:hypothetical protein
MAQTRTITFPDGDYPDRLNAAYAAYNEALKAEQTGEAEQLLATEDLASEVLRKEYEALKAEAEVDASEKRRIVTLRALGRTKWRELKKAHPARVEGEGGVDAETAKSDRRFGVNMDSIEDDLVFASVTDPKFTSRADFDEWAEDWAEGEWKMLVRSSWSLVNVASIDPKSLPSSPTRSDDAS